MPLELGIYTFADLGIDPSTGQRVSPQQKIKDLIEEIELADQVGLDVFGIGEHHRDEYLASSPATILAAAAVRTQRIRLTSAVTVLSSEDPVRVFQQFATVDLLSGGRAEIMAGRGSFIESFPLFGYSLDDYDELFSEKLDLLLKIRSEETISWSGQHRAALNGQKVLPRPIQNPLPIWVGVGGTPESVVRAATLGLPMALAIIGGMPARFAPLANLYRQAAIEAGHDPDALPISINSHGFIADTSQEAADRFFPGYADSMTKIGRERGWPPTTRGQFDASRAPGQALLVGSPQEVIDKLAYEQELFDLSRFLIHMGVGYVSHAHQMRSIELFGTKVAPFFKK